MYYSYLKKQKYLFVFVFIYNLCLFIIILIYLLFRNRLVTQDNHTAPTSHLLPHLSVD
jgi:hypothetical protein